MAYDPRTGKKMRPGATITNVDPASVKYSADTGKMITSDNLKPTKPSVLPDKQPETAASGLSGYVESTANAVKSESDRLRAEREAAQANAKSDINTLVSQITQTTSDIAAAPATVDRTAQDTARKEADRYTSEIEAEDLAARRRVEALQKNNPKGLFGGALEAEVNRINRESASKKADLAILQNSALRNYETAKSIADRQVELTVEPLKIKLDNLKFFYEQNKADFNKEDDRLYSERIAEQEREYNDKKELAKNIMDIKLEAAQNGAPISVLTSLSSATTIDEAIQAAGEYLTNPDTWLKIQQLQGAGMVDNDSLNALAAQYAATGSLPSKSELEAAGVTAGQVAMAAKALPKQAGTIVDSATGLRSKAVSDSLQGAYSNLYSVVELAKQLKDLDQKRWGGVVAGTAGKVFGSEDQRRYLDLRSQIVDLLSRARSGAALTTQEEERYNDMLPGRFSNAFFTGTDTQSRIDNFITNLTSDLQNKTASQGLSIYGFTPIEYNGAKYKVGDLVELPDKSKGIILPDGGMNIVSEPTTDGPTSFKSVSIPKSSRLAYVNNNPGNLRYVGQPGATKGEGGFARFASPAAGAEALVRQVKLDQSRGLSLAKFVEKYAPPTENDTALYIKQAVSALGVSPGTNINTISASKLAKFMAKKESSTHLA